MHQLTLSLSTRTQTLEVALAEACQPGLESDRQREMAERLQEVDVERERKRERLAEEERLAGTVRDMAGRKVR